MDPNQDFNDEIKSGEPEGSTTVAPSQGPGGSRAGPGGDGQLRQTAATTAAPNPAPKKWDILRRSLKKWDVFLSYRAR